MKKMRVRVPVVEPNKIPGKIVYQSLVGDHLIGIADKKSDVKILGVYVAKEDDVFTGNYEEVINLSDNIRFYEIGKFMRLLLEGDNVAIESLFAPLSTHSITVESIFVSEILNVKLMFCSKGFANAVLTKARESLKKSVMNSETLDKIKVKLEEKKPDIRDYIKFRVEKRLSAWSLGASLSWKGLTEELGRPSSIENCALKEVDGIKDHYDLYYDVGGSRFGNGMVKDNEIVPIKTDDIPNFRWERSKGIAFFDRNAFENHPYFKMINNWKNKQLHNDFDDWMQDINNKDIYYKAREVMHAIRLLDTLIESFENQIVRIRREESLDFYKSIINGKEPYEELLLGTLSRIERLESLVKENKSRPFTPNNLYIKQRLYTIRKKVYYDESLKRSQLSKNTCQ